MCMNIFVLDKGEYKYSSARKFFPGQNGEKSAVIILLRSMNISLVYVTKNTPNLTLVLFFLQRNVNIATRTLAVSTVIAFVKTNMLEMV